MPAPPQPDAAGARACAALIDRLPQEVDPGVGRRGVVGDARRTAAYGDPPVLVRCGVPAPERVNEPVTLGTLEGAEVQFTVRDIGDGYSYTTLDRAVPVEVTIPGAYDSPAEIVQPLVPAVVASLPRVEPPAT